MRQKKSQFDPAAAFKFDVERVRLFGEPITNRPSRFEVGLGDKSDEVSGNNHQFTFLTSGFVLETDFPRYGKLYMAHKYFSGTTKLSHVMTGLMLLSLIFQPIKTRNS